MSKDAAERERRSITRRDALRILAVGGAAGAAWKLGLFGRDGNSVEQIRLLMGTQIRLTVIGDDRGAAEAAADATLQRMANLEALLSRHQSTSEVSRLNATGRVEGTSDALQDVLQLAHYVSQLGDGAFDITVLPLLDLYHSHLDRLGQVPPLAAIEEALPLVGYRSLRIEGRTVTFEREGMGITLDGIGKGYIVDQGVATLKDRGFPNVFVEAGGDLVAAGTRTADTPWKIAIRNPRPGLALHARFDAENRAVATSGDYMQSFTDDLTQHHILDPRTGYSAPELASSTVIAPDAATADALATLTMVLGPRISRDLLETIPGCEGYFISKDLEVTRTRGFALT
jgi:thiamine biosynthesis lipoprotein